MQHVTRQTSKPHATSAQHNSATSFIEKKIKSQRQSQHKFASENI